MKLLIIALFCFTFLQASLLENKSYEATFKQTITNNSSKEILYVGKLYYTNNGNILWAYKEPIVKNVYINKNKVIIDEPELEQAIVSQIDDKLNLVKILNESKQIDKKTFQNTINNVIYTIKTYKNNLKAIFYTDEIGNIVKITFQNEKINHEINPNIFNFNPPLHYDIIRK
jgi:outer membrane lipoprotein carrier protein